VLFQEHIYIYVQLVDSY